MLGIRYFKTKPTTYVMRFRQGKLVEHGAGRSFFYYGPTSTIVQINISSVDAPFLFEETTSDFQDVTVQGQMTYRVIEPQTLAAVLDHTTDYRNRYVSDDPTKVQERLVQAMQTASRGFVQQRTLHEILTMSDTLSVELTEKLSQSRTTQMLGVEILSVNVLSIKAEPEMTKAMQAEAREKLLLKADEAVYSRRNVSIQLEREISENQIKSEQIIDEKRNELKRQQLVADIAMEEKRTELVEQQVANQAKLNQSQAEALTAMMQAVQGVDWRVLAATLGNIDSKQTIAMAFEQLAANAEKIHQLQITPELLSQLLDDRKTRK